MATSERGFALGWMVVAFTAIVQFVGVGIAYYSFGVYLAPLAEALDENRFTISLALSIQTLLMAALGPLVGRLLSVYSVKLLMMAGVGFLVTGLLVASQANSLWQLYLGFGVLVAMGSILIGNLPCAMILANWFVRNRGTAMGISQFGLTVSGVVLVPLAAFLVETYGWRTSFLCFAAGAPLLLIPLIWKLAIRAPEDVGLHPDGASKPLPPAPDTGESWTFMNAIREPDIWLISLIAGPCYMAIAAVVIALPSHGTDLGFTAMQASTVVLVTTLFGAVAKPLAGILADRMAKRAVVALAIALQVAAICILLIADTLLLLYVAGAIFGLGYGGIAPLWSLLLAERFGLAAFAKVMGAAMPITMPFSLIGLPLATYVFERSGSYLPAFAFLLLGYAAAAYCLWRLRINKPAQALAGEA